MRGLVLCALSLSERVANAGAAAGHTQRGLRPATCYELSRRAYNIVGQGPQVRVCDSRAVLYTRPTSCSYITRLAVVV